jgi:hypothetical protein
MVVSTPLIVVTTLVVKVAMDREREVIMLEAEPVLSAVCETLPLEVPALEEVVSGFDVVGEITTDDAEVVTTTDELSSCCRLCTSLLACTSTGSASTKQKYTSNTAKSGTSKAWGHCSPRNIFQVEHNLTEVGAV